MHHTCQRFGEEESGEFHEARSWSRATGKRFSTVKLRRLQGRWETHGARELERKNNASREVYNTVRTWA